MHACFERVACMIWEESFMDREENRIRRGARIVVKKWIKAAPGEKICFVTSDAHQRECELMAHAARLSGACPYLLPVREEGIHVGTYFDENPTIFRPYDVIVGAADYSIITTRAAEQALADGHRLLSLPLSTNTRESMLAMDFMTMDPEETRITAETAMGMMGRPNTIHVTAEAGTDLRISMKDRDFTFFNGTFWPRHNFSSASFEICIPIVENSAEGVLVCDGSFGYIGKVDGNVRITFHHGRIQDIEDNAEGRRLKDYLESYHDPQMYVAGELGIGLNEKSRCAGECYIEDESTYGTFHIGVGRNIGIGGRHTASGHFDLVTWHPDISFDDRMVMKKGSFLMPRDQWF